jgi:hypothetical protein
MKRILKLIAPAPALVAAVGCLPTTENTGPTAQETCTTNHNGTLEITQPNTVIDRWCVNNGSVVVKASADGTVIKNSVLTADPPTDFVGVLVEDGAEDVLIDENEIDCRGDEVDPEFENAQSIGMMGSGYEASDNEIRHCAEGLVMGPDVWFHHNLIHLPDNSGDLHADGVQMTGEADNWIFEWNVINYPNASGAFQFHTACPDPPGCDQVSNAIVRYNQIIGGASALRIPGDNPSCQPPGGEDCGPWTGIKLHGNRIGGGAFFDCTGIPASVAVWGEEEPPHLDWNQDGQINSGDAFGEANRKDDTVGYNDPSPPSLVWENRTSTSPEACAVPS